MRDINSRGGMTGGKMINEESAHKAWIGTLDDFTTISKAIDDLLESAPYKSSDHPDTKPAAMRKDLLSYRRAENWFKETFCPGVEQIDLNTLMSFSTGLVSFDDGGSTSSVNPE